MAIAFFAKSKAMSLAALVSLIPIYGYFAVFAAWAAG